MPMRRRPAASQRRSTQAGYTVWWDAMIEGGAAYAKSIGSALEAADAVIVMWSAASVESDWVRDEAAQARDRHRLIPAFPGRHAPAAGLPPISGHQIRPLARPP